MRYQKLIVLWGFVFYLALTRYGFSQDGQQTPEHAATTDVPGAERAEATDPKHEIQFVVSEEPEKMKLFRADPKLLEQKYVANVDLAAFSLNGKTRIAWAFLLSDRVKAVIGPPWLYGRDSLLFVNVGRGAAVTRVPDFFRVLEERLPAGVIVSPDALQFFLSPAVDEGYVRFSNRGELADDGYVQFRILAPSKEAAMERAEALIAMLEYGIAMPLLDSLREEQTITEREIEKLKAELEQAEQDQMELAEKLEDAATNEDAIDADELSRLKTQRRLLDVDLTGLRARIEAAEKILRGLRKGNASEDEKARINKLEDIKITAEIDLAGLAARRERLDLLIRHGIQRADLEKQRARKQADVRRRKTALVSLERSEHNPQVLRGAVAATEQLFALRAGKVSIAPITWTE